MRVVAVPNELSEGINKLIDDALAITPAAAPDREFYYNFLLEYFDEHGVLPKEISLVRAV